MIALDLKLGGAIDKLGEIREGYQVDLSPTEGWGAHHLALMERQLEQIKQGGRDMYIEILASIEALMELPFCKSVAGEVSPTASRNHDLTGPLYELTLNAIERNRITGSEVILRALVGQKGLLLGATNDNPSGFDPEAYVKAKSRWFLRDLPGEGIQRGKGFHRFHTDPRVCVFFDQAGTSQLFTGILVPYSLSSYELRSSKYEGMRVRAMQSYAALGERVKFPFDPDFHKPPRYPDCSHESQKGLKEKLERERPELLKEYEMALQVMNLFDHPLFHSYLEPEKHLLSPDNKFL